MALSHSIKIIIDVHSNCRLSLAKRLVHLVRVSDFLCLFLISPQVLLCLPLQHQVIHGSVKIEESPQVLTITASDQTILNWKDFSIEENETTRFVLPNANSSVLNRVIEMYPSRLLGNLEANGRIILVNPCGVLVGANSQIDTASFVASSIDVLDSAFLESKDLLFTGESEAPIINLGKIFASEGEVFLLGRHVESHGIIEANADAGVIAASTVILKPKDLSSICIRTDEFNTDSDNFFSYAFHRNESLDTDSSHAIMTGSIKSHGDQLTILGDQVELLDRAQIDLSQDLGGGTILVGGDFQGNNPNVRNASKTFISEGAIVAADARQCGNGGKIIAWGDDSVTVLGKLSARGGLEVGDGGFIEVSSKNQFEFGWLVDVAAPNGKNGTLLLDPTDITITAAASTGGVVIGNPTTLPALTPVNINNGNLATFLNLNGNVLITTNVLPNQAGAGNISVSAAVTWDSVNSLTLIAANNITVTNNIQNGPTVGTGNVTLDAGGANVTIGTGANVSVGSINGTTTVNAPAATVLLQPTLGTRTAQIGYFSNSGDVAAGPINVNCNTLVLRGSVSGSSAQIGHGQSTSTSNSATTNTADITVVATGDITLDTFAGGVAYCVIGHGSRNYDPSLATNSNQDGDITVTSLGGSIVMQHPLSGNGAITRIGHGFGGRTIAADMFFPTLAGNITVFAQGNISLISNVTNGNNNFIGHGGAARFFTSGITGDILVQCCGDLTMNGNSNPTNSHTIAIGSPYFNSVAPFPNVTQNIRVGVGGNILMQARQRCFIGSQFICNAGNQIFTGDIEVVAGGNITMNSYSGDAFIGVTMIGEMAGDQANSNVFVASGGNLTMSILIDPLNPLTATASIHTGGTVAVASGGNITLNSGTAAGFSGPIDIGTSNRNTAVPPPLGNTRIFAAGNIIANNGATQTSMLGYSTEFFLPPYNVQIRAGGDIQMADSISGAQSTTTGNILIEADSNFLVGELWGFTGANLTSVCSLPFNPALPLPNPCPGSPVNGNSPAQAADGVGGFYVNTLVPPAFGGNIILETTTGDITVNSACNSVLGPIPNLNIGNGAADNIQINTINGNITIAGSICSNAFRNVLIDVVVNPWTSDDPLTPTGAKGNILVRACDTIFVYNDVVSSGPAGALGSVTMIADNNLDGTGNLEIGDGMGIMPTISTINGSIALSAGLRDASCQPPFVCTRVDKDDANINHRSGSLVTCLGSGTIVETASGSINLTNSNIIAQSGSIHLLAGSNINIGSNIQNFFPMGEIILVANENVNLLNAAALISSPNLVTIVADNAFPAVPLLGTGRISTAVGSRIIGNPLQIYTSQQGYNSILGTLNGILFSNGTLFQNSSLEQWCTYFGCPFQIAGLGFPYTVFYKNCLTQLTQQAMVIVDEILVNLLHPYNEYPGWIEEFFVSREGEGNWNRVDSAIMGFKDAYIIRRRLLHGANHPKSWTHLMSEGRLSDFRD